MKVLDELEVLLQAVQRRLLQRIEKEIDNPEGTIGNIKTLAAACKDLRGLSPRGDGPEGAGVLTVRFEGEAEDYSD